MNASQRASLRGSCLCGRITYTIHEWLEMISHCHCPTCRKAHAAAFASTATIKAESLEFTSGESLLHYYESSPGKRRYFCSNCGSHIYSSISGGGYLVSVGTLDSDPGPCLSNHIFTHYKVPWYNGQDTIPEYAEMPEGTVADDRHSSPGNVNLLNQINAALNAAMKRVTTTSLLLLEIDHFLLFGDNYGEERMEEAIFAAAAAITKNIREADAAALYGESGFAVLLPYTDAAAAIMIGERIRKIIQAIASLPQQITVSIGIASVTPDLLHEGDPAFAAKAMIEHAELALHQAQKGGGNQLRHFSKLG